MKLFSNVLKTVGFAGGVVGGFVAAVGEGAINKLNGKSDEEIDEKFKKTWGAAMEGGFNLGGSAGKVLDDNAGDLTKTVVGGLIVKEITKDKNKG